MGNRPSSGAEGTHVAEILQSPRTEDEAKIAGGYKRLLLITNRKWHIGCQITCKSSTLADLESQCTLLWLSGAK